jgi:hypothetical protein
MTERPRGKWSDPGVPHKGWTCDRPSLPDISPQSLPEFVLSLVRVIGQ